MNEIVKILAPFAASENDEYNALRKKLYCVWQMPTGLYVSNGRILIKVNKQCDDVQCININLKCYEKYSNIPLKEVEVNDNFFDDGDFLVKDNNKEYYKTIFNNPPDMDGLLQENKKADITSNIFVNVINTLKSIPKECEYIVINNTVFNSYLFTNLLKVFKKLGDKEINMVFRGEKCFSVEFVSEKIDAVLMPIYRSYILNDMSEKHKENNNSVVFL